MYFNTTLLSFSSKMQIKNAQHKNFNAKRGLAGGGGELICCTVVFFLQTSGYKSYNLNIYIPCNIEYKPAEVLQKCYLMLFVLSGHLGCLKQNAWQTPSWVLVYVFQLLSQQLPSWIFGHIYQITFTATTILVIWLHLPDYFHSSHHLGYLVTCSGLLSQQPLSWIFGHMLRITFTAATILDIWSRVPD